MSYPKSWLGRLVCSHIYKEESKVFLRDSTLIIPDRNDLSNPFKKDYSYYAITKCCVKCGNTVIVEERMVKTKPTKTES